ncbi:hypothetical protein Taro_026636 [Colocasia esculenta]|uniref:Alpha-mannosidase n=1 Tax=Colocasia esculenta TaxID=4460 RepID=A0A843VBW4_COLES|nr:hypothetical protein [Colocasia esculenta]
MKGTRQVHSRSRRHVLSRSDRDSALCLDGLVNAAYRAVAFTGSVPEYNRERTGHWIAVVSESVLVRDSEGSDIESQLLPILDVSLEMRKFHVQAYLGMSPKVNPKFWLAFPVSVPPLGFSTYIISNAEKSVSGRPLMSKTSESATGVTEIGHGNLKLTFDEGRLSRYLNSRKKVNMSLQQSYIYYAGDDGSGVDFQASGAYIFRPNGTVQIQPAQVPLTVMRGPLLDEVHQQINPWIHQVGPVPVDDKIGKEVVTQITTHMTNDRTFYTDSNGRDFIKRIRDYRTDWDLEVHQPVAGNYYPINLGIYMVDNSLEFSVLVDRSVGGSSISDGQLELMLHRRLLHDDGRGVAEALNETVCVDDNCAGLTVQGKFYVRIDPLGDGSKWRRSVGQEIYSPLLIAFSEQKGGDWMQSHVPTFTAMDPSYSLPDNVALITLQALEDGSVLLRLAHLYEVGEDKDLSVMAKVELTKMFPDKKIENIKEMSLSANQGRAEMEKKRLVWKVEGSTGAEQQRRLRGGPVDLSKLVVELGPMEIRTFVITFSHLSFLKVVDR